MEDKTMKYLAKNVGRDDHAVEAAQINMLSMIPAAIWGVLFCVLAFGFDSTGVRLFFIGLGLIIVGVKYLDIICTHLGYSTKKLIGKAGIIGSNSMDAPLNKIDNVNIKKSLFGMILNYSTLNISTASGQYSFKYIKSADAFKQNLMDHIDLYEKQKLNDQAEQIYRMNAGRQ